MHSYPPILFPVNFETEVLQGDHYGSMRPVECHINPALILCVVPRDGSSCWLFLAGKNRPDAICETAGEFTQRLDDFMSSKKSASGESPNPENLP